MHNYSEQRREQTAKGISAEQWRGMNTQTVQAAEKPDFNNWAKGLKKESEKQIFKLNDEQINLIKDSLLAHRKQLLDVLDVQVGIDAKTHVLARMRELDGLINTFNI